MNKSMYNKIENYMYECMKDAAHDPERIFRVLYLSLNIASCLLHDIGREEQYKNQKECAQLFYNNLIDQIKEIYGSREIINEYITR